MSAKRLSECTSEELDKYQVINVDRPLVKDPLVIFGVERVDPPSDDYEYSDITTFGDAKQQWVRGKRRPVI